MKIVVLVKQVPDTWGARLLNTTTGLLDRGASDAVIDEIGERAIEVALVHKDSDKSAEALKGKGHPVVPEDERMEVLAALSFVDYVTSFSEPTADPLLELLRPSLYAKGSDYTLKTLPEKDTLKALDIKAVFVGDKKAHSTTKMIQKIQKLKKK